MNIGQIYGNLNLNGLFLDMIRSQIDSLRSKTIKQIKASLIANLKGIILEFLKSEVSKKQPSSKIRTSSRASLAFQEKLSTSCSSPTRSCEILYSRFDAADEAESTFRS